MRTSYTDKDGPWVWGVVGGVFVLVGIVCAVAAVWIGVVTHSFLGRAQEVDGLVVGHSLDTSCSGTGRHHDCSTTIKPVVSYVVDGLTYKFADSMGDDGNGHPEGSHVVVLYDPDKPSHARLQHGWFGTYLGAWITGLLAVVFGGVGLGATVVWRRTRRTPLPEAAGSVSRTAAP